MSRLLGRVARVMGLVLLAMLGTIALMRYAPGYFTDSRELDAQYANVARGQLAEREQRESSFLAIVAAQAKQWAHGDLGRSEHYDVPVTGLLRVRAVVTAKLIATSVLGGWLLALTLALPLAARRSSKGETLIAAPVALLLAIPVGAMATACLLMDAGGPVLVLTLIVFARDFKFVYRLLRHAVRAPQLLFARAQGLSMGRIFVSYLLPMLRGELIALAVTSFTVALSAFVPVEVIFDVPGLGQLAWNAAMNRDLPVLLAVTLIMAVCIGLASLFTQTRAEKEAAICA